MYIAWWSSLPSACQTDTFEPVLYVDCRSVTSTLCHFRRRVIVSWNRCSNVAQVGEVRGTLSQWLLETGDKHRRLLLVLTIGFSMNVDEVFFLELNGEQDVAGRD